MKSESNVPYIRNSLCEAVKKTLLIDWEIIAAGCHEQAISHRIAMYLEGSFEDHQTDCEYNRFVLNVKLIKEKKRIRPDIVVHKRLTNINLLAVEVKSRSKRSKTDHGKLKALISDPNYKYKVGAFIQFFNSYNDIKHSSLKASIQWFQIKDCDLQTWGNTQDIIQDINNEKIKEIYLQRRAMKR